MGTLLGKQIGSYKINKLLGKGGMGEVYLATDEHLDRYAALKVLKPELSSDENFIKRFSQEAKTLAKMNHPHIATLYTILKDQGQYIMAMEYIDGTPFDEYLKENGPLSTAETLPIIIAVLDGLQHAHEKGIVHRDLKPSNIMFNKSGIVKVMDFGIARGQKDDRHTKTGMIIGTLDYMAPELIKGDEASFASDLYAMGIILYQVLSHQFPFSTTSEYSLMQAHIKTRPTPINQYNPSISKPIIRYINKLLQKNPEKRFASTQHALAELRQIYNALPSEEGSTKKKTSPLKPSTSLDWQEKLKKHWPKLAFAVSILLLLAIGVSQFTGGEVTADERKEELEEFPKSATGFSSTSFETPTPSGGNNNDAGKSQREKIAGLIKQGEKLSREKKYLGDYPSLYLISRQILDLDANQSVALAWIERIVKHYYDQGKKAYGNKDTSELKNCITILQNIAKEDERTKELMGLQGKLAAVSRRAKSRVKENKNPVVKKEPTYVPPKREENYTRPAKPEERIVETPKENKVKDIVDKVEDAIIKDKPRRGKKTTEVTVTSGQAITLRILETLNTDMPLRVGQRLNFELVEPLRDDDASLHEGFKVMARITIYKPKSKKATLEIKINSIRGPGGNLLHVKRGVIFLTADKKNEALEITKGSTFKVFASRTMTFKN